MNSEQICKRTGCLWIRAAVTEMRFGKMSNEVLWTGGSPVNTFPGCERLDCSCQDSHKAKSVLLEYPRLCLTQRLQHLRDHGAFIYTDPYSYFLKYSQNIISHHVIPRRQVFKSSIFFSGVLMRTQNCLSISTLSVILA